MHLEQYLKTYGSIIWRIRGTSMLPLLRQDTDLVTVTASEGARFHKYDIVLYSRFEGADRILILHRVVKVLPDSYVIRGDNCYINETGITDQDILGRLTEIDRKGHIRSADDISLKVYAVIWTATFPLRKIVMKARQKASKNPLLKRFYRRLKGRD